MDDKQKLSDFLLMKLQECKLKPYDGAIYGEAADYIAEQLIAAGYRKQSDVVSEFVERLLNAPGYIGYNPADGKQYLEVRLETIEELAAEFGAEVEE